MRTKTENWKRQPRKRGFVATPISERFHRSYKKGSSEECWPWTGYTSRGYGIIYDCKRGRPAHRLALELATGASVPTTQVVRHLCGNPLCVNPGHLAAGTQSENMRDMVRHGRAALAKYTDADVMRLRKRYAVGDISIYELAIQEGITRQGMRRIIQGKSWTHLPVLRPAPALPDSPQALRAFAAAVCLEAIECVAWHERQGDKPMLPPEMPLTIARRFLSTAVQCGVRPTGLAVASDQGPRSDVDASGVML